MRCRDGDEGVEGVIGVDGKGSGAEPSVIVVKKVGGISRVGRGEVFGVGEERR